MVLMQRNRCASLLPQEGDQFVNVKLKVTLRGSPAGLRDVSSTFTLTMSDEHVSDHVTCNHELASQLLWIASTTAARASAYFRAFSPLANAEGSQRHPQLRRVCDQLLVSTVACRSGPSCDCACSEQASQYSQRAQARAGEEATLARTAPRTAMLARGMAAVPRLFHLSIHGWLLRCDSAEQLAFTSHTQALGAVQVGARRVVQQLCSPDL